MRAVNGRLTDRRLCRLRIGPRSDVDPTARQRRSGRGFTGVPATSSPFRSAEVDRLVFRWASGRTVFTCRANSPDRLLVVQRPARPPGPQAIGTTEDRTSFGLDKPDTPMLRDWSHPGIRAPGLRARLISDPGGAGDGSGCRGRPAELVVASTGRRSQTAMGRPWTRAHPAHGASDRGHRFDHRRRSSREPRTIPTDGVVDPEATHRGVLEMRGGRSGATRSGGASPSIPQSRVAV